MAKFKITVKERPPLAQPAEEPLSGPLASCQSTPPDNCLILCASQSSCETAGAIHSEAVQLHPEDVSPLSS